MAEKTRTWWIVRLVAALLVVVVLIIAAQAIGRYLEERVAETPPTPSLHEPGSEPVPPEPQPLPPEAPSREELEEGPRIKEPFK